MGKQSFWQRLVNNVVLQHKAGLFVALVCGLTIGVGLSVSQQPTAPTLTANNSPVIALFEQAGWATTQRYHLTEALGDKLANQAAIALPAVEISPSNNTTPIESVEQVGSETVLETSQAMTTNTPTTPAWLPETERLIQELRDSLQAARRSQTLLAQASPKYNAVSTGFSEVTIPETALAMPALSSGSLLKSVVSATAARVEITHGKAVVLNLSEPVSRVTMSDSAIATASLLSPTEIQLVGKGVGVANVILWSALSGEQDVVDVVVHRDLTLLKQQLTQLDGRLKVAPADDAGAVALTGNVDSREVGPACR